MVVKVKFKLESKILQGKQAVNNKIKPLAGFQYFCILKPVTFRFEKLVKAAWEGTEPAVCSMSSEAATEGRFYLIS